MEEVLIVILQLFFELLFQLLVYGGFDLLAWWIDKHEKGLGCLAMLIFALIGAGFGGIVNLIHPGTYLAYEWLRIANVIVGPLLAGWVSWLFAEWRRRRGAKLVPSLHFWFAFCFVLGFDLVRFAYAQH